VAPAAESVVLVQRTPAWILPRMDRRLRGWEKRLYRRFPLLQRAVRTAIYWGRELYVVGFAVKPAVMSVPRRMALRHLERQVPDPELRAKLTPGYEIGCKRILISNDFYRAVSRPDVELVTGGLTGLGPRSIRTADGGEHEVDVVVFGTGFRVTDLPIASRVHGRGGRSLAEVWNGSMHAHRGCAVPGFPNLFFLVGPNTGLGHSSQVFMIETQVEYVVKALEAARRHGADVVEVRAPAEERWNAQVQARMQRTVWATGGCSSWYVDPTGRISVLWPASTWRFRLALRRFDAGSYRFEQRPASARSVERRVAVEA
jgi:cation diffusion facilitator CzcD-associated flavoprotein CzcO